MLSLPKQTPPGWRGAAAVALVASQLLAPAASGKRAKKTASTAEIEVRSAEDLLIVDCLLPPKLRRLGRRNTYLEPRRPIRSTAVECRIRGGEHTAPDQASLATALKVWLPQARAGNAEAQFYAGQIFERGLGTEPDYQSAREWYQRAAEQGYAPAQINLGYLYEAGLGTERDELAALNWYRAAAGLAEDMVMLGEADYEALRQAERELEVERQEVEALEREVESLRQQIEQLESASAAERQTATTLRQTLGRLQAQLDERRRQAGASQQRIAELERAVEQSAAIGQSQPTSGGTPPLEFGTYHALVLGNGSYQYLPELATAVDDAQRIAELLRQKYGFQVELLTDATRFETMSALNRLRKDLTQEDNLLVFYAGHGWRDERGETAYWQPIDAEEDSPANWISSSLVAEHLDLIPAKHVLLLADSVFSGLRTRSSVARLPQGMTDEERHHHLRLMLDRRSRLALTSGASKPIDSGENPAGSVFSKAVVAALEANHDVLEASRLYYQLNDRLSATDNPPEFASMRWARNNVADFFFVPRGE